MTAVRWASVLTVAAAGIVALWCLFGGVLRGHPWAWVPCLVAGAIALREVRHLQRTGNRDGA
ncbi:hypothetical protein [Cellulomonas sp. PhB143]|uniref:hypothetical protein n=1 Tax=Cellulomonas sp. PhB143 TaxID=2485186 RepID=UPI000F4AEEB2|nr:hypothetical protein [Cellulomonas sp. PhB143]ROS78919.1 hypothetical protein EDF32_0278 [Cellulomonas sp. PhB143]